MLYLFLSLEKMPLENQSLEQQLLSANDADFIKFFQNGENIDQL
jgi:hypothetical protein